MSIATESLSEKTIVKEEIDEVDENGALSNEADEYILQQQVAYDKTDLLNDAADETGEPQPKRAKRAAALKALIHTQESEEDEEDIDEPEPITKAEEESEPSETDINESVDDTFAGGPSTSADDQPGPSGVGKSTEGPESSNFQITTIIEKEEIEVEETTFLDPNEVLAALDKSSPKKLPKQVAVDIKKTTKEDNTFLIKISSLVTPNLKEGHNNEESKDLEKNDYTLEKKSKKLANKSKKRIITIDDIITYQCPTCKDEKERTVNELRQHYNKEHMVKTLPSALLSDEMHPCDICGKEFKDEKALREHIKIHNDSYTCAECGVIHQKIVEHVLHLRLHSYEGAFQCIICEYVTDDVNEITSHCNKAHQTMKKFHCSICDKGFTLYSWFVEHYNYHTGIKPFICEYCGKYFLYSRYLSAHRNNMHRQEMGLEENLFLDNNETSELAALRRGVTKLKEGFNDEESKNSENSNSLEKKSKKQKNKSKQTNNENDDIIKYQCPTCKDERRWTIKEVREHYKKDHAGKSFRPSMLSNKMHPCDICGKEFKNINGLRYHIRHMHNNSYICEKCGVSHKKVVDYVLHLRLHSDEGIFKCIFCEYVTQDVNEITSHCNNEHKTVQEFNCTICNKKFSLYSWFVEHDNYHTGKKPFGCEYCGKHFLYSRYLSAHKNNMHREELTGLSNFHQCVICKTKFRRKKYLTLHMNNRHMGNCAICDVCGMTLVNKERLKVHMRRHTGYKPYSCPHCEKCFIRKPPLVEHVRIHTGEKPYVCEHCNKGFSQRSSLVIHIRSHTGERPYSCHICQKRFVARAALNLHFKACKGYN